MEFDEFFSTEEACQNYLFRVRWPHGFRCPRCDMSDDEIWRTYSLLTRVENAFRNMKSPLCERPIFH